jgi:hypothetical protein
MNEFQKNFLLANGIPIAFVILGMLVFYFTGGGT